MIDLHAIATEQRNEQTRHIDRLSTLDMIRLINEEDKKRPSPSALSPRPSPTPST